MIKNILSSLVELQSIDRTISELETILSNTPNKIQKIHNELNNLKNELETITNKHTTNNNDYNKLKNSLKMHQDLLDSAGKKLASVKNKKEYEAALKELDNLRKIIFDEETKLAELENIISTLASNMKELSQELKIKQDSCITEVSECEQQTNEQSKTVKELHNKREDITKKIKNNILSKYERIRTARGNLAVVKVNEGVCTGCYMKLPPQLAVNVKKETELLECPYCQRFLYHETVK